MSVNTYSFNLKRTFVQPIFDKDNFRSEFRLSSAGEVLLPSLTLLNHGSISNAGNSKYLAPMGIMGLVKKISLFDGNVKLDDLVEFSRVCAFKKFNRPNSSALNIDHYADGNAVGFVVEGNRAAKGTSADIQGGVQVLRQEDTGYRADSASKQGIVNLAEYLSFLRSAPSLPTSVFKNLRVVIDYESNPLNFCRDSSVTGKTIQPLMAVDVVKDDSIAKSLISQFRGVVWKAIEHDQVLLDAVSEPATRITENKKTETKTFHGFNNKRVGRMFMAKQPLTASTFKGAGTVVLPYGDKTSISPMGEEVQFRVNGSNKLARNGMTGKNEMLGMLVDTYGDFVCPAGCNQAGVFNLGAAQVDANTRYNRDVIHSYDDFKGMQGYIGLDLGGEKINELKVDYTRVGAKDSAMNNQSFNMHLFGEVQKSLAVSGDSYVVAYA